MNERPRLYLITPPHLVLDAFAPVLAAALAAGDVAAVQLRLKGADGTPAAEDEVRHAGAGLMPLVQGAGAAFIVNDSPELALRLGADGVHLGQHDMPLAQARRLLGPDRIIGVTCHASRHLAMEAAEAGADYVAFGAFYPTATKAAAAAADPEIIAWWAEMMEVPCVAIGGITPANAAPLLAAGADFLAVSGGVWNHPAGAAEAVRAFNRLCEAATRPPQ